MTIERYISTCVVKIGNDLIPFWDKRITFDECEEFGCFVRVDGSFQEHVCFIEAAYDLKEKKIYPGIELNCYPTEKELEFKKGDIVYLDMGGRRMVETTVKSINYEKFDSNVKRGSEFESWLFQYVTEQLRVVIDPQSFYIIKHWTPTYVFQNGRKEEYNYKIFHKSHED